MPSSCTTRKRSFAERSGPSARRSLPFVPFGGARYRGVARIPLFLVLLCAGACARKADPERSGAAGSATAMPVSTAMPTTSIPPATAAGAAEAEPSPVAVDDAAANAHPAASAPRPPAPRQTLEIVSAEGLLEKVRARGGKGTLVSAWASWCGPCKRELPLFQTLAERYRPQGIDVLLVSVDEHEQREKAETFLVEHGIALRSYLAERPLGPFKQGLNPRWPGMLPASFLFDRAGGLRYFWGGEAFEQEVTPILAAFVAGKPIEGEAGFAVAPGQ